MQNSKRHLTILIKMEVVLFHQVYALQANEFFLKRNAVAFKVTHLIQNFGDLLN